MCVLLKGDLKVIQYFSKACVNLGSKFCEKGEVLMERHNGKNRWLCERCLTITQNNEECPKCGCSHLREIRICSYAGAGEINKIYGIGTVNEQIIYKKVRYYKWIL